jgi:hypothetical protein
VTGSFQGALTSGPLTTAAANGDAFLLRLGAAGAVTAERQLHAATMAAGVGVARTGEGESQGVALALRFGDDVQLDDDTTIGHLGGAQRESLVVLYDANADEALAHHRFEVEKKDGIQHVTVQAIAANATHVVVAGSFAGSMVLDDGPTPPSLSGDAFVAKLDLAGKVLWTRTFGGVSDDVAYGVAIDAIGRVAVTGIFRETMSIEGTALTSAGQDDVFVVVLEP